MDGWMENGGTPVLGFLWLIAVVLDVVTRFLGFPDSPTEFMNRGLTWLNSGQHFDFVSAAVDFWPHV